MIEFRPSDEDLPILADEAHGLISWIKSQHDSPLEAASIFYSSVKELVEDNRGVPSYLIDAANRCFAAAIENDRDGARRAVEAAAAIVMEHFRPAPSESN